MLAAALNKKALKRNVLKHVIVFFNYYTETADICTYMSRRESKRALPYGSHTISRFRWGCTNKDSAPTFGNRVLTVVEYHSGKDHLPWRRVLGMRTILGVHDKRNDKRKRTDVLS